MTTRGQSRPIAIAIVGLGFGEDFLPIYQAHPDVGRIGIVDTSRARLDDVGDRFGIDDRFERYEDVLASPDWDAVHVLAPVRFHEEYAIAALEAGKHCASAVPMATTIAGLEAIIAAQRRSERVYMMMETSAYGREYLLAKHLYDSGRLGTVSLYEGFHIQNLDGYPDYWRGFPPMHYATHALSPVLALTGARVARVTARGSGLLTDDRVNSAFDNPYASEVGLFELEDSDVVASITMSFFQTARTYTEGFNIYGSQMSLEWPAFDSDPLRVFELGPLDPHQPATGLRGRRSLVSDAVFLDPAEALPADLVRFAEDFEIAPAGGGAAIQKNAEHGGSHPYLVHEFISSIVEDRAPLVDAATAAEWTAPGICAHDSALRRETVEVPRFRPT